MSLAILAIAIYILGIVVMAAVIRLVARMAPEKELDRGAAVLACFVWPGALGLFTILVVFFLLQYILFGPEKGK